VLESVNDWTLSIEYKHSVKVACIDFSKAFDSVSSDITGILAQMIDDPSTCPLPYYRAPNTDD